MTQKRKQGIPFHVVFLTDATFKGDFGEAAADAHCAARGAMFLPDVSFNAVLSTSARQARDKLEVTHDVHARDGAGIATGDAFWGLAWFAADINTESGLKIYKRTVKDAKPPFFSLHAWTGTKAGGLYDEASGACGDWTTAASGTRGFAWNLHNTDGFPHGSRNLAYPCARPARLLCFGKWMPP